jgi:hypothetical protein
MFKYLSAAAAAVMFAMPGMAQTIHDFDGSITPSRPTRASKDGNCFVSKDKSRICFFRIAEEIFSLAIVDIDTPQYPLSVVVDCSSGQFKSWGVVPQPTVQVWASVFCENGRY